MSQKELKAHCSMKIVWREKKRNIWSCMVEERNKHRGLQPTGGPRNCRKFPLGWVVPDKRNYWRSSSALAWNVEQVGKALYNTHYECKLNGPSIYWYDQERKGEPFYIPYIGTKCEHELCRNWTTYLASEKGKFMSLHLKLWVDWPLKCLFLNMNTNKSKIRLWQIGQKLRIFSGFS